jgi:threonine-phosphate decarboxylase
VDRLCHDCRDRLLGAHVKEIEGHGGNIYRAARERGCHPSEWCDFSASINPLGPAPSVLRILRREWWTIAHYPDPDCHEVRRALSKQFGLPADWFLVGNGSAELIDLLPRGLRITHALVVGPTFSQYETAVTQANGACIYCHAERDEHYRPPIDAVTRLVQEDRNIEAVFLCNPNSPTGRVVTKNELLHLIEALDRDRRWAIIDEAFAEFAPDHSMVDVLAQYPRLVVLRSCTKFFGIPGLRLGYLVGHPAVLEQVRRRQPPWSVNAPAQLAAVAALEDVGYRKRTLRYIEGERTRFASALQAVPGVMVFPSAANFLLVELPLPMPAALAADRLRGTGILVRDCSNVPGLNEYTIRVAIRRRRDNDRLCRSLNEILHG